MLRILLQLQNLEPTSKWMLVGLSVLTIVYAVSRPLRKKKDPLARAPSSLAGQRSVEREMSNLLVELSQMARQVTAQLDTRAAKLEMLMKEADERIALLKSLGNLSPPAASISTESGGAHRIIDVATPAIDPRHAQVYALADQGSTPRQIAQQLGRQDGEVELILALRPGK